MRSLIRLPDSPRRLVAALLVPTLLVFGAPAFGAPSAGAKKAASQAEAEFKSGQQAYNLGRFGEALAHYSEAYKLKPLPELLFNIAQCHRQLDEYERAAFFYRRYLALARAPRNAPLAMDLLKEVEKKQQEQEEAQAKAEKEKELLAAAAAKSALEPTPRPQVDPAANTLASSPETSAPRAPVYRKWWFWTGVGVVVAGAASWAYVATRPPSAGSLGTIDARGGP